MAMRHCTIVRKGLLGVCAVVALCAAILPSLTSVSSAATSVKTSTYLLYAGHGIEVVATASPFTGCSSVFLTSDLEHWRNITPPVKSSPTAPKGQCDDVWSDASFISPTNGWLMAINGANVSTTLSHTLNAGRTWTSQPGGATGSAGGWETISFVNASLGWRQQFGMGSNGDYALQRTVDAGTTWSTRSPNPRGSCAFANDVFSSASVGFASPPWTPSNNPTKLWRTTNGGKSWSTITFPTPPSLTSNALGIYGEPEFSGENGVEAVDFPASNRQYIYFYVTHDGGLKWTLDANSHLPLLVDATLAINRQEAAALTCSATISNSWSHAAIVDPVSATTWWVLQPGPKGSTREFIVSNAGTAISSFTIKDLPATFSHADNQADLAALNASDALITLPIPYGYRTTYQTSNGGRTWQKVDVGVAGRNN